MIRLNAIIVKNLSKYFNPPKIGKKDIIGTKRIHGEQNIIRAVDNIGFEIKEGEIFRSKWGRKDYNHPYDDRSIKTK